MTNNNFSIEIFNEKMNELIDWKTSILNEHGNERNKINDIHNFISALNLRPESEVYKAKAVLLLERKREDELNKVREAVKELLAELI